MTKLSEVSTQASAPQIAAAWLKAEAEWNAHADKFNQWYELGQDEKDSLFAVALASVRTSADD